MPKGDEPRGDRLSLAYFSCTPLHFPIVGPSKVYPTVTFAQLLEARKVSVPLAFAPGTTSVAPDALQSYHKRVAGPEVAEHRWRSTTPAAPAPPPPPPPHSSPSLAVVDLADFERRKADVGAQLLSACEGSGFFYCVNHGIPQAEVDAAFARSRAFFALPAAAKRAVVGDQTNPHYVLGYTEESTGGAIMREGLLCAHDNSRAVWPWEGCAADASDAPDAPDALAPGWKAATLAFMAALHAVACRLLGAAALALGLPEGALTKLMDATDDGNASALFCNRCACTPAHAFDRMATICTL